ncbi:NAD(P)/FAD-dependent oxidoreductase [Amycolatopsis tucumanensis]|uniref:NAD(P)/FAD-dependent oxidoreductase n=1 Tax=Amycolatopsis tucumanensis TaxID=401106 RepID=A0ABP7HJP8_9PSEU|nr:NAD(P)/FAD-dependent oxidoreductase [Amycolatopsis tucumanensis]MCF6421384.1 NAD(P)/FAD-dependent oxidoreductase [Amycolatopsis tucumanensis]
MYDVIVVGARCAGSPLAMLLARHGHRVLVVDRASFPSDTVSTHYLHQAGLARLQDWGLLDRLIATGVPAIRELNFTYTGIDIRGFADPIDGIDAVYCPRRTVLDELLVGAAREAGAEVIEGFTVSELVFDGDRVIGIRGSAGDAPEQEFRAQVVVGADGAGSIVAQQAGAQTYRHVPAAGFIYYSYYSGLDWGMHHRTGFGEQQFGTWPTNDGLNLLAIIRPRERFSEFRADPERHFQDIFDQIDPEMGEQLRDAGEREEPFRPMRYPDNYYRRSWGPGWALVGDAAYHKDPFTGWGITDAFKYAELLAQQLHSALSGERSLSDALSDYEKVRDAESAGTFQLTVSLSTLKLTPYYDAVFRATSQSPSYTRKFFGLIAGGYHGEEFFAPHNLEQLYDEVGTPAAQRLLTNPGE